MSKPCEEELQLIESMVSSGYTDKEIGLELNLTKGQVVYRRNLLGINKVAKYTDEELLNLLYVNRDKPAIYFCKKNNLPSYATYMERFGSWSEAKNLVGTTSITKTYNDEELINILKGVDNPSYNLFNSNNAYPSGTTYANRFGSWNAAMELAGKPIGTNSLKEGVKTLVYLVEFEGFYKIGITQQEVSSRLSGYPKYEVLLTIQCETLAEAKSIETTWLHNVKKYKFISSTFPRNKGATECFKY